MVTSHSFAEKNNETKSLFVEAIDLGKSDIVEIEIYCLARSLHKYECIDKATRIVLPDSYKYINCNEKTSKYTGVSKYWE